MLGSYNSQAVATFADVNGPKGVLVSSATGIVYIADTKNNRIRSIFVANGVITTVIGTGVAGYSGDRGVGTSARLSAPSGLAFDRSGNLYIADTGNNVIRKWVPSKGIITTVAGGFMNPTGVALDKLNNIYVVNTGTNTIQRVEAQTTQMSTVAGNGKQGSGGNGLPATLASLNNPTGIAVDSSFNVFIADTNNHQIRMVDGQTGVISVVAGTGVQSTSGVSGNGDGGYALQAQFSYPTGVSFDSVGDMLIADTSNYRIRKINIMTGAVSTLMGSGVSANSGDGSAMTPPGIGMSYSVSGDLDGLLYVADATFSKIRVLQPR